MNTIRVIWKKKNPNDKVGYLRLSSRVGNKTILKSLSLEPIEQKYFNPKNERVRISHSNHEYINNYIDSKIKEVEKKGNKIKFINDDRKSLIVFMDKVIEKTSNQGTIQKYTNIKNLLQEFNSEKYGDLDIKFSEISVDYIDNWKKWLRERGNTNNSISYKTKCFQSFISKGIKQKIYSYDVNPFLLIKNKIEETTIDILDKEDLKKLMETSLKEVYRNKEKFGQIIENKKILEDRRYKHKNTLDDIRNYFLIQLFLQGIRVSDLMTLRWNDFYIHEDQIRIRKRMIKTKSFVDILVNYNTMDYFRYYVPYNHITKELRDKSLDIFSNQQDLKMFSQGKVNSEKEHKVKIEIEEKSIQEFNLKFEKIKGFYWVSVGEVESLISIRNQEIKKKINIKDSVKYIEEYNKIVSKDKKLHYLNKMIEILKRLVGSKSNKYTSVTDKILIDNYKMFIEVIEYLSTNKTTKTMFCLPILNDEDFKTIGEKNDFSSMSKTQYLRFSGGRTYYNRLLKVISDQCKINKPLRSHLSRHSFTSLMLEIGENLNLFDLMSSLGHKHLTTTQGYIQKFNHKRVDILNKQLSDFLNNKK